MNDFESYVKSNWNVVGMASCGIKYTYTSRETTDKKSDVRLTNHTINLTITWFDKDNNKLQQEKLAFTNDDMSKTYDKKMFIINRKELVNKFRLAKREIVSRLINEKFAKLNKINGEIEALRNYIGREDDIIPHEMKNTVDITNETPKKQFDM